jgi:hypothetical protein
MDGSEDGQEAVLETVRASITLRLGTGLDPRHSVSSSLEMTMTTTVNRDGEDGPLEDRVGAIMPQIPHLVEAHPGNRSGRAISFVGCHNSLDFDRDDWTLAASRGNPTRRWRFA